jgi:hypothetical protein
MRKSNISDAVRWVLGEQSARRSGAAKMRTSFRGTEKRRRLSCSEVTLTIENEDKALPIDFSEVAVTRRVYRDGNGEYQINGAPCRLRDVIDLFRDTGIGREGYSLIGQGRIDEILSGKSDDRRRAFEEAAGIVTYKARKAEAEKRIENTRMNLDRAEDILRELDCAPGAWPPRARAAREYMALREELRRLDLNAFSFGRTGCPADEELTAACESLSDSLAERSNAAGVTESACSPSAVADLEEAAAASRAGTAADQATWIPRGRGGVLRGASPPSGIGAALPARPPPPWRATRAWRRGLPPSPRALRRRSAPSPARPPRRTRAKWRAPSAKGPTPRPRPPSRPSRRN